MHDKNEQSEEHAETDEDDDYDTETDADGRFSFHRYIPDELPFRKTNALDHKKRMNDAAAAGKEFERVKANWVECKVKWSKFRNEKSSIICLNNVTNSRMLPRNNKDSCFMTPVGKSTTHKGTLEAEQ